MCIVIPWTWSCVVASNKRVCFMSTSPKLWRKSAPKIGFCTSAITKINLKVEVESERSGSKSDNQ